MSTDAQRSPRGPSLRIVCVNDVYALDNFPRLVSLLRPHAAASGVDRLIATMAGDFLAPSVLSSLDHGQGMIDCMNATPFTHAIFGNHEADIEPLELGKRVQQFKGTWLNTNMPEFAPKMPTHDILEVGSPGGRTVRIGLIGLLIATPSLYRKGAFGGHSIEPANEAAVRWARRLTHEEGCACVIPLTHQGRDDDITLARTQRDPPFPVIIGGHDHDVFLHEVDGCWIIKAGTDAAKAAIVDLVWPSAAPPDGAPDLPAVSIRLEDVGGYPEDPEMSARVHGHLKAVRDLDAAALLRLPPGTVLSSVGTRVRQTSLGTLICSRMRDALQAEGCLMNGGGIRGSREYRDRFTYGDLKTEVPFPNEVVVVSMPGRVIREAVAMSRSRSPTEYSGYLQLDDQMITDERGVLTAIGGLPLSDERDYRIATVRGLLAGMDNIEPLVRFARHHPDKMPPPDSGREPKLILLESFSVDLWRQLGSFDRIDADRDGVVTAGELKAAVASQSSEAPSDLVIQEMLKVLDADGDRAVSRQEAGALAAEEDSPTAARTT